MATKTAHAANLAKFRDAIKHEKLRNTRVALHGNVSDNLDVISTGSSILDQVIGVGGVPRGRITEIFGDSSVGKTTLATTICAQAQKTVEDAFCLFIDFEHAFSPDYSVQGIGLDLDEKRFDLHQPDYFEQGIALIDIALKTVQPTVIVVDSVAAMTPKKEFEAEIDTDPGKFMGLKARLLSSWLQKVIKSISDSNSALVLINQMRSRIKTGPMDYGPDEDTTGGKALKFYSSLRIHLKPGSTEYANVYNPMLGKKEKTAVSNFVRAQTVKNKIGGWTRRQGEFCIRYGEGIDNVRSIIDVAINHNIIEKSTAWYKYTSDIEANSFQRNGVELVRSHLLKEQAIFIEIAQKVRTVLEKYTIMKADQVFGDDELERHDLTEDGPRDIPVAADETITSEEIEEAVHGSSSDDVDVASVVKKKEKEKPVPSRKAAAETAAPEADAEALADMLSEDELKQILSVA